MNKILLDVFLAFSVFWHCMQKTAYSNFSNVNGYLAFLLSIMSSFCALISVSCLLSYIVAL